MKTHHFGAKGFYNRCHLGIEGTPLGTAAELFDLEFTVIGRQLLPPGTQTLGLFLGRLMAEEVEVQRPVTLAPKTLNGLLEFVMG